MTLSKIIRFIAWGIAGFFGFIGFLGLFMQPLVGLIFLFFGVLFAPITWNATQQYGIWQNLLGRIAAFFVGMTVFSTVAPPPTQPPQAIRPAPIESARVPSPAPSLSVTPSPSIVPSPLEQSPPIQASPSPQILKSQKEASPAPEPSVTPSPAVNLDAPVRDAVSGSCDCPYDTDKRGNSCGRRSAYSRPGGRSPICYESDRQ